MKIKENGFQFSSLDNRKETSLIVLHHRAGSGDAESLHKMHLAKGWSGIGYQFYIRKDGTIERGRPIDTVGAHTTGYNNISVGVCFEGNFEKEDMTVAQIKAGQDIVAYLRKKYPSANVRTHNQLNNTLCPGERFEAERIKKPRPLEDSREIIEMLLSEIEILEVERAVETLEKARKENSSLYWILYKLVNKKED